MEAAGYVDHVGGFRAHYRQRARLDGSCPTAEHRWELHLLREIGGASHKIGHPWRHLRTVGESLEAHLARYQVLLELDQGGCPVLSTLADLRACGDESWETWDTAGHIEFAVPARQRLLEVEARAPASPRYAYENHGGFEGCFVGVPPGRPCLTAVLVRRVDWKCLQVLGRAECDIWESWREPDWLSGGCIHEEIMFSSVGDINPHLSSILAAVGTALYCSVKISRVDFDEDAWAIDVTLRDPAGRFAPKPPQSRVFIDRVTFGVRSAAHHMGKRPELSFRDVFQLFAGCVWQ